MYIADQDGQFAALVASGPNFVVKLSEEREPSMRSVPLAMVE